jgi:hypothetical protein
VLACGAREDDRFGLVDAVRYGLVVDLDLESRRQRLRKGEADVRGLEQRGDRAADLGEAIVLPSARELLRRLVGLVGRLAVPKLLVAVAEIVEGAD